MTDRQTYITHSFRRGAPQASLVGLNEQSENIAALLLGHVGEVHRLLLSLDRSVWLFVKDQVKITSIKVSNIYYFWTSTSFIVTTSLTFIFIPFPVCITFSPTTIFTNCSRFPFLLLNQILCPFLMVAVCAHVPSIFFFLNSQGIVEYRSHVLKTLTPPIVVSLLSPLVPYRKVKYFHTCVQKNNE